MIRWLVLVLLAGCSAGTVVDAGVSDLSMPAPVVDSSLPVDMATTDMAGLKPGAVCSYVDGGANCPAAECSQAADSVPQGAMYIEGCCEPFSGGAHCCRLMFLPLVGFNLQCTDCGSGWICVPV